MTKSHSTKDLIMRCFNRASYTYDDNAYIQNRIGENLINLISQYCAPHTILDLGCGTGIITQRIAQSFNFKKLYAVDIADRLLAIAKKRLSPYTHDIYLHDFDKKNFQPHLFDLVLSNMALQWSPDFLHTLACILQNLTRDGICAFSIPIEGTFLELPKHQRLSLRRSAWIRKLLHLAHFKMLDHYEETLPVHFTSYINALRYLKALGVNYKYNVCHNSLKKSLLIKSQDPFTLTYQIAYFIARKVHAT